MISVVVPTYNRSQVLPRALESLAQQCTYGQFEFEVLVVDNGSTDSTASFLQTCESPFRGLHQERPGESWARNLGIEQARGDWIAFFDDDQKASPDWLYQLWNAARESQCPIVAGNVHLETDARFLDRLGPHLRALLGELKWPADSTLRPPQCAACSNALVQARVFEQIGKFDVEKTVAADTEFFLRAYRAGLRTRTCPEAVVLQNVPEARLQPSFFKKRALWQGTYQAELLGQGRLDCSLVVALPRILKALLWHLPGSLLARDDWRRLGHQSMLWKAVGTWRGVLALRYQQSAYFEGLRAEARRRNQVDP